MSNYPHTTTEFQERMDNTNTTKNHIPHRLYDERGNEIECHQRDTIQRIFTLWQELEAKEKVRDNKIKKAFNQTTKQLEELRKDLDERKLINNYTKNEKDWLIRRVESIGEKSEEVDTTLADRVTNLEKAVVEIAKNDENQDKSIGKLEKLLYVAIGLIISFFLTFGYKTLILGI